MATAIEAKVALVNWLLEHNHTELIHVDLIGVSKLRAKPVYYPSDAEYLPFSDMYQ